MFRHTAMITLAAGLMAGPLLADDATPAGITLAQASTENTYLGDDPEMYADLADARVQDVEEALAANPGLLDAAISSALRRNPGVVKEIIRDTLMRNPELVVASLQEYQRRQQAGAAAYGDTGSPGGDVLNPDLVTRLGDASNAPVRGNPQGTVTLVEFADYNCPHCRSFSRNLDRLIAANPELRVIQREWPILGQDSLDVAKIALAAQAQGAYETLHHALMAQTGAVDAAKALEIAEKVGLDTDRLKEDAENPLYWEHIRTTAGLAEEMALQGTPGVVIGDQLARGAISVDQAQPLIDAMKIE